MKLLILNDCFNNPSPLYSLKLDSNNYQEFVQAVLLKVQSTQRYNQEHVTIQWFLIFNSKKTQCKLQWKECNIQFNQKQPYQIYMQQILMEIFMVTLRHHLYFMGHLNIQLKALDMIQKCKLFTNQNLNSVPQLQKPQFHYYSKFQAQINHSLQLMTLHQWPLTSSNTTTNTINTTNTTTPTTVTSTIASINFNDLLGLQLDANPAYYTYVGSLTIPDCDENVNWYILDSILAISQTQLDAFNTYFLSNSTFSSGNGNNRAIQSTNDRTIKKGGVECEEQFVYFFSFFILYIFINYFIFKLL